MLEGMDFGGLGLGLEMGARRLIGAAVEVFGADLCTVTGLAVQKVAVMKLIERNRLLSAYAGAPARSAAPSGVSGGGGSATALTPLLLLEVEMETDSEMMTVVSERSGADGDGKVINDTPVPEGCEVLCNCGWLVGLAIFILGNVLELVAFSFASQTDVALLSNFTLVWNAVISVVVFKEEFNVYPVFRECSRRLVQRWDAFHCVVLMLGSMVSVFCAPQQAEDDMDAKELLHMWTSPPYVFWAGFMLVTMLATAVFLVRNWRNHLTGNLNAALIAGLCGFVAAFCATLSKVTTTLISRTAKGHNQFDSPEAILLCSLWVVLLVSQLALLNVGLGAFEQGLVVPIYEIVGTLCSILSGILFYRTYDDFTLSQGAGFLVGVGLMSWGVWLVAHREVHTQQELSDNLHSNLSAVDELLHLNAFGFDRYLYDDSQPHADSPARAPVLASEAEPPSGGDAGDFDFSAGLGGGSTSASVSASASASTSAATIPTTDMRSAPSGSGSGFGSGSGSSLGSSLGLGGLGSDARRRRMNDMAVSAAAKPDEHHLSRNRDYSFGDAAARDAQAGADDNDDDS